MSDKLLFSSIDELHASYKAREVSPVEVLEATFERLERLEPRLNAFVTTLFEEARAQAKEAEGLFSKGAPPGKLTGVPVSIKDLFDTSGTRTSMGSRILRDHVPERDSFVYEALRSAGAVVFGKTNMLEFAYGFVHPDYGQCNNPWDTSRTAGGSSSGSASSIAAGVGYGSVGTDTGGSIRVPASFCGIVGLKPTREAVSRRGVFPVSHTLDHVGPLTRSVRDNAAMLEVLAPSLGIRAATLGSSASGIRVGIISELSDDPLDQEVRTLFESAIGRLGEIGALVGEVGIPGIEAVGGKTISIMLAEASYHHRNFYPERIGDYACGTRANLAQGWEVSGIEYIGALQERERMRRAVDAALESVDILVCPTVAYTATPTDPDFEGGALEYILRTFPFDVTGHPALTVPVGNTPSGNLPAGIEFVAAHGNEALLYSIAAAYEDSVGGFAAPPIG